GIVAGVGWVIPTGPAWVAAHASLGLGLVAAALVNAIWAVRLRRRAHTVTSILGFLAIVGAAFNGASFLNYGHDVSSMIMAALWALALASYVAGLALAGDIGRPPRVGATRRQGGHPGG
ncbi:MAG TPA: hypothetical protein VE152_06495, partial [Acidimicrobiales bacterium]|nr:hypothetical protein [Acidimicrobiales bacterium]